MSPQKKHQRAKTPADASATHAKKKHRRAREPKKAVTAAPALLMLAAPSSRIKRAKGWIRARAHTAQRSVQRRVRATRTSLRRHSHRAWTAARPALRRTGEVLGGTAAGIAVLLVAFLGYSSAVDGRILPYTEVAGVSVGWLTPQQALERLRVEVVGFEAEGIPYVFDDQTLRLHPKSDLGVSFRPEDAIAAVYPDGRTGGFLDQQRQRLRALVTTGHVDLPMSYDEETVAARLRGRIQPLAVQPVEPIVRWESGGFAVTPGVPVTSARMDLALAATHANLRDLTGRIVPVEPVEQLPSVTDADAERAAERATALLATPVALTYGGNVRGGPWTVDLKKDPTWIEVLPNDGAMRVRLDPVRLRAFLDETVAVAVDQEKSDAYLTHASDNTWRVQIEGEVRDGYQLDREEAFAQVAAAVAETPFGPGTSLELELPVAYAQGRVLDESGEDMGLRDMLAHAQSSFAGSPAGRDYNVRKGMKVYNGLLIPQGETFAFNSFLGPITAREGWKDALTIFNGGRETRMEPGGGICQVSTTVYQAAVLAGLPIVERRQHSYFVSYYAKAPGLNGIDATIYPGSQDLVFKNDTPGPMLMLAGSNGNIAYVQLFGVKDRQVKLQGPMRYGSTTAATEFEVDPTLPPGATVVTSQGHAGFSVRWNQTVTFTDGRELKNVINSVYRAIPGTGRVGPTTVASN